MLPVRLFQRSSWGRVSRVTFWFTVLCYVILELFLLFVPLEIFYRLQVPPDHIVVQGWIWTLLLVQWPIALALYRLSLRRLRDAGLSSCWLVLALIPIIGWAVLVILLLRPSLPSLSKMI